jgi:methylmalonyl-CoA/ethylmalonyl-CoA epimerase
MSVLVAQVAVVVRDLEAAMDAYSQVFGWGPWRVYDFTQLPHVDTTVRGEPLAYTMRTAVTNVGGLDFELIEPAAGASHYQEFLAEHGEGLHHVMCTDSAGGDVAQRLVQHGMTSLMSGSVGDAASYAYYDGGDLLGGLVVETMADGPKRSQFGPSYLYSPDAAS